MNRLMYWGTALIMLVGAAGRAVAQPGSMFSDPKAAAIGDVLTVIIAENASATNQTATTTGKSNQAQVSSTIPGGGNILSFIPLHSLQSSSANQFAGKASTSRSAQLTARITVTVVGKKPNGDLLIEGMRNLKINGETEAIYLSGVVNPASVASDNTVSSSSVGELQLEYTGKGTLTQGARPGLFVRMINWVF